MISVDDLKKELKNANESEEISGEELEGVAGAKGGGGHHKDGGSRKLIQASAASMAEAEKRKNDPLNPMQSDGQKIGNFLLNAGSIFFPNPTRH